jgi:hypothetical protein
MTSELGTVVEGDGLAQALRDAGKQARELTGNAARDLAGETDAEQQT